MLKTTRGICVGVSLLVATAAQGQDAKKRVNPTPSRQAAHAARAGKAAPAATQPAAPTGGVMVFVDPATGAVRQPDASEIGGLAGAAEAAAPGRRARVSPREATPRAEQRSIQGPGGAVGLVLGEDTFSYAVVTKSADGKLTEDCLTGAPAAASRARASQAAPKAQPKGTLDVQ